MREEERQGDYYPSLVAFKQISKQHYSDRHLSVMAPEITVNSTIYPTAFKPNNKESSKAPHYLSFIRVIGGFSNKDQ